MYLIASNVRWALLLPFFLSLAACPMDDLPRNQSLKAFDPHRADFVCKHEADAVPPIDPEAEQWFQQGLALTSMTLWPDQRDYKKAAQLWQQAADRKHWKAMLNLASAYVQGEGVERDTEHAVQIVEQAMQLGIPAAYDLMGTYHMNGTGVKQDASRAYAVQGDTNSLFKRYTDVNVAQAIGTPLAQSSGQWQHDMQRPAPTQSTPSMQQMQNPQMDQPALQRSP